MTSVLLEATRAVSPSWLMLTERETTDYKLSPRLDSVDFSFGESAECYLERGRTESARRRDEASHLPSASVTEAPVCLCGSCSLCPPQPEERELSVSAWPVYVPSHGVEQGLTKAP